MSKINYNQRLNGLNPLAYIGVVSYQPPEFVLDNRAPTPLDKKNFDLGTIWLNTTNNPPTAADIWMLVSLQSNTAKWVNFAGGSSVILTLTSNSGGAVPPLAGNINVLGDITTIVGVGNPATNTITFSTSGTGVVSSLTGNSGGAVFPTAGNINVVGTGVITVVGNPGTSTLTITPSGAIASSFPTDSGTATPSAGVLTIKANVAALGCGSSVEFTGSGSTVLLNVTDANSNTIIGNNAGNLTLTSTNTTCLGKSAGHALTSSSNNTIIGSLAGNLITSGSGSNTIIGKGAGPTLTTASTIICLGAGAGSSLDATVTNSTVIGESGRSGLIGDAYVGIGVSTGPFAHNYPGAGGGNVFMGIFAGGGIVAASNMNNVGIGQSAAAALSSGANNTMLGFAAGEVVTTGGSNTLLGVNACTNAGPTGLTTGSRNIAIGASAGGAYTGAESDNIIIAGPGVVGESRHCRIGFGTNSILKTFVDGIRGITTDNNNAIAVLIDSAGQLGTVSSSARVKENIKDLGSMSNDIYALRPVVFNYIKHSPESKSFGLIAEEVDKVMPQLVVYKDGEPETVKYLDLIPMMLNEIQKLKKEIDELKSK